MRAPPCAIYLSNESSFIHSKGASIGQQNCKWQRFVPTSNLCNRMQQVLKRHAERFTCSECQIHYFLNIPLNVSNVLLLHKYSNFRFLFSWSYNMGHRFLNHYCCCHCLADWTLRKIRELQGPPPCRTLDSCCTIATPASSLVDFSAKSWVVVLALCPMEIDEPANIFCCHALAPAVVATLGMYNSN